MKKSLLLGWSVLLLSTVITLKINAQEPEAEPEYTKNRISPSALVNAAHKGRFKEWNIPSYGQLQLSYDSGQITANDLVNAAVEAGKLSSQAANDEQYINNVDTELKQLHED